VTRIEEPDKRALRAELRRLLSAVPPRDTARWSADVCRALASHPALGTARTVMAFAGLPGEPDLSAFFEWCWKSGRVLCLPRVDWDAGVLRPARVRGVEGIGPPGRHGVREPIAGSEPIDAGRIDLVLVPGLGFDREGRRLGRGGGFYDRFLAAAACRAVRWGVGFEIQVVPRVPCGAHDVRLHALATENGVLAFDDPADAGRLTEGTG